MNTETKILLGVGGAAAIGYVIYRRTQSNVGTTPSPTSTGTTTPTPTHANQVPYAQYQPQQRDPH